MDWWLFLIQVHSVKGSTATTRQGFTRKKTTKELKHTENMFRKNVLLKDVC